MKTTSIRAANVSPRFSGLFAYVVTAADKKAQRATDALTELAKTKGTAAGGIETHTLKSGDVLLMTASMSDRDYLFFAFGKNQPGVTHVLYEVSKVSSNWKKFSALARASFDTAA